MIYKNLILFGLLMSLGSAWSEQLIGHVQKVVDGDSVILLQNNNKEITVNINAIDAPELGQSGGRESKQSLEQLILNKEIVVNNLRNRRNENYGDFLIGEIDLAIFQLRSGSAWYYIFGSGREDLKQVEDIARRKKIGLWNEERPVPPWIYRRSPTYAKKNGHSLELNFWVTKSTGIVHNSNCRFYNMGDGKIFPVASLSQGMRNCKVCQGSYRFAEEETLTNNIVPNKFTSIKLGLSLSVKDSQDLQNRINKTLRKEGIKKSVLIHPMFGYDQKTMAIRNNEVDIMEGGFLTFYEFTKRRKNSKVILHAFYFRNDGDQMFYISGLIIKPKGEALNVESIPTKTIFAVSESSSSGFLLQKGLLEKKGVPINNNQVKFLKSHSDIEAAVLATPNSIGFIGSFAYHSNDKVDVVLETNKTPGGLIYADRSIVNGKTLQIIRKAIYAKFLQLAKGPNFNRMFVMPLEDDYKMFFPNYEPEESYVVNYVIGLVIIVLFMLVHKLIKNKNIQQERYDELVQGLGIDELIKEMSGYPNFKTGEFWIKILKDNLHKFNRNEPKDVIINLTQGSEKIIEDVVKRINFFINSEKKIRIDKQFCTYVDSFFKHSKALETSESVYSEKYEIDSKRHLARMKNVMPLNPQFALLYHYRNLSHHPKDFWEADGHAAKVVLLCYAQVIHTLIISQFFED